MGSSGKSVNSNSYEDFSDIHYVKWENDREYVDTVADRLRGYSNIDEWYDGLTSDERNAFDFYTEDGYRHINALQYNKPWEDMDDDERSRIASLHNAINKFRLEQGIHVSRACNFQIFGAPREEQMTISEIRDFLKRSDGLVQNDGFMSFSTHNSGIPVDGSGLVIHLDVPPSLGAGAYIGNTMGIDMESEFLLNSNSILHFDYNSMYQDSEGVHINATLVGRAKAQKISPTYTGMKVKSKGGKK